MGGGCRGFAGRGLRPVICGLECGLRFGPS